MVGMAVPTTVTSTEARNVPTTAAVNTKRRRVFMAGW
jgi:hypothetical protein